MNYFYGLLKRVPGICMVLLLLLGAYQVNASHFAAADIYVDYVGESPSDLRYKVTLVLYKACEPDNASLSDAIYEGITYSSQNAGFSANTSNTLGPIWGSPNDTLDQLCPQNKTQNGCRTPLNYQTLPGFVRKVYDTIITLPSRQRDWVFSWSSGARNAGIKNLLNPTGNIYVEAGLDNLIRYDNNTPRFYVDPVPYLCINQPATYLNGPIDPNGDSLDVISHTPYSGPTTQYTYNPAAPGYSLANPIASTAANPYAVNQYTGTATFTPTVTGYFVLAFRCNKYDKATDRLIGWTYRDVQVSVLTCAAGPPNIDTLPITLTGGAAVNDVQGNIITTCAGTKVNFQYTAKTVNANGQVYIDANNASIIGSSLTITGNGTTSPSATFDWSPTQADIGEHILIIQAIDSTCDGTQPIVLKSFKTVLIRVISSINAGPDMPVCEIGGKPRQIIVKGAEHLKLKWTDISGSPAIGLSNDTIYNPLAKPAKTTTYVVETGDIPNFCKFKDEITIYMDTTNTVSVYPDNPIVMCRPGYMQLDATINGRPPRTPIGCGIVDTVKGDFSLDSVTIVGGLVGNYDTLGPLTITLPNDVKSVKQQFLLRKEELFGSDLSYGTLKTISFEAVQPGDTSFRFNDFTISLLCTEEYELKKTKGFVQGAIPVYSATSQKIDFGWNQFVFDKPYSWDTSKNLIVQICYDNTAVVTTGAPIIRYVPTDYVTGLKLTDPTASVCNVNANVNIVNQFTRPYFGFTYRETRPANFDFKWFPGTLLSDTTIRQPLAYVAQSTKYWLHTSGRSGCIIIDSADVYVPKKNYTVSPSDTAICFGERPMITAKGGFTYKWWEYINGEYRFAASLSEDRVANPVASPKVTTMYKIVVYDSLWCTDTIETKLTVLPLPDIKVLNRDTVVKYGKSLKLLVSGARTYNWMPAATLSTPFSSNPVATPTEPTAYVVGGIGSNGCRSFDTVTVGVDYKDNLFIPSAFSPNGDGRNDLFKITNLSNQRVSEFRVFNRWGQEIFATSGNKAGWDGTWKGVAQDIGNYSYLIRVAFPDGEVETYKGEVMLTR